MRSIRTGLRLAALLSVAPMLTACAHKVDTREAEVDSDWVQPRVDEAARAASKRCLSGEPERVVEIEVAPSGVSRAWVHPYPAAPQQQACADEEAARVHVPQTASAVRALMRGDGKMLSLRGARERALVLRSRLADGRAAAEQCRQDLYARIATAGAPARAKGPLIERVGFAGEIDGEGRFRSLAISGATASVDDTARACLSEAVKAVRFPSIPGEYRFSYLLSGAGLMVSAPDVQKVDPYDQARATAAIQKDIDKCLSTYQLPGMVLVILSMGSDGVARKVSIERAAVSSDDAAADLCLRAAGARLRVPPFEGESETITLRYTLR